MLRCCSRPACWKAHQVKCVQSESEERQTDRCEGQLNYGVSSFPLVVFDGRFRGGAGATQVCKMGHLAGVHPHEEVRGKHRTGPQEDDIPLPHLNHKTPTPSLVLPELTCIQCRDLPRSKLYLCEGS